MVSLPWHSPSQNASPLNLLLCLLPCVCVTRLPADIRAEDADWKQHIHCRQNQQARGHQSGGVRVLTQLPRGRRSLSCVRSSDSTQLSSWAVLHSRVVASRVCGRGRSESPSTAVACLGCRLNSVSPDGDGAARRWGCNHRTLVSARARGETPPPAAEASEAASDRLMRLQRASRVSGKCLTDRTHAARAV